MNTATRVIHVSTMQTSARGVIHVTRTTALVAALVVGFLLSAFGVIYLKDLNRRLFIQYQGLEQVAQSQQVEYSKLLLEQSTLSTQARVQRIAQAQLSMVEPTERQIVLTK